MDQLLMKADFLQPDNEELQNDFMKKLQEWMRDNRDKVTLDSTKNVLKTLQHKICQPGFPSEGSSGYWMGYHALKTVMDMIGDLINDGRAKPFDFQSPYLEFILNMVLVGPTSSHIEYILKLRDDSDVEFQEYFQSLTGTNLSRVISALKRDYPSADPGLEWELYVAHHLDKFARVILDDFSDDQLCEAQRTFMDLFIYFHTNFINSEEKYRKQMYRFAYLIELKFERNMFKGLQDAVLLKHYLSIISEVILAPEFPQAADVGDEMKGILSDLLKAVSEEELLTDMYGEIMDLALNLTIQKASCQETRPHFETIGYFFFHVKESGVKHNENLFDGLVTKFISFLDKVKDESYLMLRFVRAVMDDCLAKAMGVSDDQVAQWIQMIKALMKHSVPSCIEAAYYAMREKDKLLKWKNYPEEVGEVFELLSKVNYPDWLTEEQRAKGVKQLEALTEHFLSEVRKAHLVKDLSGPMLHFVFHCMEMRSEAFYSLGQAIVSNLEFNPKKDKALIMEIVEQLTAVLGDKTYPWDDEDAWKLSSMAQDLASKALDPVKDGKIFSWEEYDALIGLLKQCQDSLDVHNPDSSGSVFYRIFCTVFCKVLNWLQTMNETERIASLVVGILDMADSDVKELQQSGAQFLGLLSQFSSLLAPHLERLMKRFLETEDDNVMWSISNCYEHNPGPMSKYFSQLFEHVDSGNAAIHTHMLLLVQKVAKYQPDLFTEDKVTKLAKEAREETINQATVLMTLEEISKRRTEKIAPHVDELMSHSGWQTYSMYYVCRILQFYGLQSEERAEKVVNFYIGLAQSSTEKTTVAYALSSARLIGYKYRSSIEKHRSAVMKIRSETREDDCRELCTSIIDILDGKTVEKVAEELKALQEDVADIQIKVESIESDVLEVKDAVQQQGHDLDNVKNDVTEHGQRLDQVEETVEETVVKVEEIDGKTLNHAPFWSRDVSKLLNPETDHDWRLLSHRLGYNNDDIRGWAQQADPCMAMLNEWYATHKTREATHAILTALQDMGREDAATIVENAMKNAEAVVEEEEFEYATPPEVFISYQWSHQNEVRLLRQHLEMAGYSCWMDVGQMGGGDKLFEKIDSGIRAAKVMICCVTEKYAKSPNCNREVNLAVSLGKPTIPLLMEKTSWPPPGSMGPIFSEYLYIRFFTNNTEGKQEKEADDQRYWSTDKFQELLMQLSMNRVVPDHAVVQPEYKDWWVPKIKEVVIDRNRNKTSSVTVEDEKVALSPDVFISYQWGRQPQVLRLYQKLTSLGYTCWLDIMQMGGGDSLYDKIDRGLRGCRVVVSCVTSKYAVSANCRREVSLADALNKPLIPVLLESVSWPPPGPMGPILSQLLYINCRDMDDAWTGPGFDSLVSQINQHVPRTASATDGKTGENDSKSGGATGEKDSEKGIIPEGNEKPAVEEKGEGDGLTLLALEVPPRNCVAGPLGLKGLIQPETEQSFSSASGVRLVEKEAPDDEMRETSNKTSRPVAEMNGCGSVTRPSVTKAESERDSAEAPQTNGKGGMERQTSASWSMQSGDCHDLYHPALQDQAARGKMYSRSVCCIIL